MREYKFRAYGCFGGHNKKPSMVDNWQDSEYIESIGFNGGDFFKVMQYTWRKDKNGNEIYDGYIIKCYRVHYNDYIVFEVESILDLDGYEYHEIEIIGNIHENPELLP